MSLSHILILDDDVAAALVTRYGLVRFLGAKVDVQIATSPETAWLRCCHELVDLVIVEPAPHNYAATAFVKALCAEHPQIPVLVLTAYDTPLLRRTMRELGITSYLTKSVDLATLARTVTAIVESVPSDTVPAI